MVYKCSQNSLRSTNYSIQSTPITVLSIYLVHLHSSITMHNSLQQGSPIVIIVLTNELNSAILRLQLVTKNQQCCAVTLAETDVERDVIRYTINDKRKRLMIFGSRIQFL